MPRTVQRRVGCFTVAVALVPLVQGAYSTVQRCQRRAVVAQVVEVGQHPIDARTWSDVVAVGRFVRRRTNGERIARQEHPTPRRAILSKRAHVGAVRPQGIGRRVFAHCLNYGPYFGCREVGRNYGCGGCRRECRRRVGCHGYPVGSDSVYYRN